MRLSRLNYDKVWRCPGWSGGAWRPGPDPAQCEGASFASFYFERKLSWLRFTRCPGCGIVCLPLVTRWADPAYLSFWARRRWGTRGNP